MSVPIDRPSEGAGRLLQRHRPRPRPREAVAAGGEVRRRPVEELAPEMLISQNQARNLRTCGPAAAPQAYDVYAVFMPVCRGP
jgi:hypothetical protein